MQQRPPDGPRKKGRKVCRMKESVRGGEKRSSGRSGRLEPLHEAEKTLKTTKGHTGTAERPEVKKSTSKAMRVRRERARGGVQALAEPFNVLLGDQD